MRLAFITLAIAAGLSVIPPAQALEVVKATCPSNHVAVVTSDGLLMTNSTAFVDVTDSTVRFVQGGNRSACVLVTFSAEAAADGSHELLVRALLDGAGCASGPVALTSGDASAIATTARAMSFLCTDVTPGAHRIRMQYRSGTSGQIVSLHVRTLTVHYFK